MHIYLLLLGGWGWIKYNLTITVILEVLTICVVIENLLICIVVNVVYMQFVEFYIFQLPWYFKILMCIKLLKFFLYFRE